MSDEEKCVCTLCGEELEKEEICEECGRCYVCCQDEGCLDDDE